MKALLAVWVRQHARIILFSPPMIVLHYTGYTHARGGIGSVIRALQQEGVDRVLYGISASCAGPIAGLELWRGPDIEGERINLRNFFRARAVARAVRTWLQAEPGRVFHGHSRAGLLVGLWLHRWGERQVVVSVHCYGRQKWFYRWAARRLGRRLFWLTPAMRRYYGLPEADWEQCLPGGVAENHTPRAASVPGRLRLGGAGFTVGWKRWDLVLKALALLPPASRAGVTFQHIGGPGEDAESQSCWRALQGQTTRLGLQDCVKWCGPEPSSRRLLAEVDVVVVPSHEEPYSMILQEALASGVPVLAAASGGPLDVVIEGKNGRFFRDGDAAALAAVVAAWWRDPPEFAPAEVCRTARRSEEVVARWAQIYREL